MDQFGDMDYFRGINPFGGVDCFGGIDRFGRTDQFGTPVKEETRSSQRYPLACYSCPPPAGAVVVEAAAIRLL